MAVYLIYFYISEVIFLLNFNNKIPTEFDGVVKQHTGIGRKQIIWLLHCNF